MANSPDCFNCETSLPNCITFQDITCDGQLKHFWLVKPLSLLSKQKIPHIDKKQVIVKSNGHSWSALHYIDQDFPVSGSMFLDTGAIPEELDTDNFEICDAEDVGIAIEMIFTVTDHYAHRRVRNIKSSTMCDLVKNYLVENHCWLTEGSLLHVSEKFIPEVLKLHSVREIDPVVVPNRSFICNTLTEVTIVPNPMDVPCDMFIGMESILDSISGRIRSCLDSNTERGMQSVLLHGPDQSQLEDFCIGLPSVFVGKVSDLGELFEKRLDSAEVENFFEKVLNKSARVILIPDLDMTEKEYPDQDHVLLESLKKAAKTTKNMMVIGLAVDVDKVHPEILETFFQDRIELPFPDWECRRKMFEAIADHPFTEEGLKLLLDSTERNTCTQFRSIVTGCCFNAQFEDPENPVSIEIIQEELDEVPPHSLPIDRDAHKPPPITLKDFIGFEKLKKDIYETFNLAFENKEQMKELNCPIPKHHLWFGAPTTGKTMMVEAISNEFNMPVISVMRKDVFSKYFGESEKNLTKIFQKAKTMAPCIIHFKNFEGIARAHFDDESVEKRVMNHLKVLLDGIEGNVDNVFVIAETNTPLELDSTVIRHGRFDSYVHFHVPSPEDVQEVVNHCLKDVLDEQLLEYTAKRLQGGLISEIQEKCSNIKVQIEYPAFEPPALTKDFIDQNVTTYEPTQCMKDCETFATKY